MYIYIYTATVDKFNSFDLTLISFYLRAWTREDATRERERDKERMKRNRVFFRAYNCLIDKCVCVCGKKKEPFSNSKRQSRGAISIVFPPSVASVPFYATLTPNKWTSPLLSRQRI